MSRTTEDNKALQERFMEVWSGNEIKNAADLQAVRDTITECEKSVNETNKEYAPKIKQAKGIIADAQQRIEDICQPLDVVLLVASRLLDAYDNKLDADITAIKCKIEETETEDK